MAALIIIAVVALAVIRYRYGTRSRQVRRAREFNNSVPTFTPAAFPRTPGRTSRRRR